MRDHDPIKIASFGGLFDQGDESIVPLNHLVKAHNLAYLSRGFTSRPPSTPGPGVSVPGILRQHFYIDNSHVLHTLILDTTGRIHDIDVASNILFIPTMTDFSMVAMFGRVYITPHNGKVGLQNEKVYVYQGSGVARPAGGVGPVAERAPDHFVLNVGPTAPSEMDPGSHYFAISFETNTGFITPPRYFYDHHSDGSRGSVAALPVGGADVVARHIFATKVVADAHADPLDLQNSVENMRAEIYYHIPNGRIPNNTTVAVDVSFLDVELVEEATEFFEQLSVIPAGTAITNYNGRLVVGGFFDNPATAYVSLSGFPESFNAVDGILTVNPGDSAYAISNLWVYRESLIINKVGRTYATIENGDIITLWKPDLVDSSIGAGPHAVGRIALFGQTLQDVGIVADNTGCHAFRGVYAGVRLSDKISDLWERINDQATHTIDMAIDTKTRSIYIAVPLDNATRPNYILYADYRNGLTPEGIRWSTWLLPYSPQSIGVITTPADDLPILRVAAFEASLHIIKADGVNRDDQYPTPANRIPINSVVQFAFMPNDENADMEDGDYHFGGYALSMSGTGSVNCEVVHEDELEVIALPAITLKAKPGRDRFLLHNSVSTSASLRLETNTKGTYFQIQRVTAWVKWLWAVRDVS